METYIAIVINPRRLYHTTMRNNKLTESLWKEQIEGNPDLPLPPVNEYHKSLDAPKYFTLHPKADYSSPWMFPENAHELPENERPEVFLEYLVKEGKTLRLLVRPEYTHSQYGERNDEYWKRIYRVIEENNYDGYISKEDFYEIYLVKPQQCIADFREISFCFKNRDYGDDYNNNIYEINKETERMLGIKKIYEIDLCHNTSVKPTNIDTNVML